MLDHPGNRDFKGLLANLAWLDHQESKGTLDNLVSRET